MAKAIKRNSKKFKRANKNLTRWQETLFNPAAVSSTPYWRYLPHWLAVAFILRAFVALSGNFLLHPDELVQYLEPAHEVVFGYGILSWEFFYGARSWIVPGFVAGILWLLDQVGLGVPWVYVYVVKLAFCILSLLVPWGIYHYARVIVSESSARLALILACLWPYLIVFAHKPMTEFVATSLCCAALGLASLPLSQYKRGAFVFGALCGLVAAVRIQYLPVAGLLWFARTLPMGRIWIITSVVGGLVCLSLVALLETYTWGAPFHSYYYNIIFNRVFDIGREPEVWHYYFSRVTFATAGGVLITMWACFHRPRQYMLLLFLILMVFVLHSIQNHKEFRFIYIILALWIIPFCGQLHIWAKQVSKQVLIRWTTAITAVLSALVMSNVIKDEWLLFVDLHDKSIKNYVFNQDNIFDIYLDLARRDNVSGVLNIDNYWYNLPGYYYLHQKVPYYDRRIAHQLATQFVNPARVASHIIYQDEINYASFEILDSSGLFKLAQRNDPKLPPVEGWKDYTIYNTGPAVLFAIEKIYENPIKPPNVSVVVPGIN